MDKIICIIFSSESLWALIYMRYKANRSLKEKILRVLRYFYVVHDNR